jgi:hypothetical protein
MVERTPRLYFDVFERHISQLVAATVTRQPLMCLPAESQRMTLSFRAGDAVAAPVETAYGRLHFYLGQALEAVEERGLYRLKTRQYWYRIKHSPDPKDKSAGYSPGDARGVHDPRPGRAYAPHL